MAYLIAKLQRFGFDFLSAEEDLGPGTRDTTEVG
jgi:hypothetical protein